MRDLVLAALEKHRYSARSVLALLIFGSIILVFVFFDFPTQRLGGGAGGRAASVGGATVSVADLQEQEQQLEKFYQQLFGGQDISAQRQFIKSTALEQLISQEVIAQSAQKEGIYAADSEVRDIITNQIEAFRENGQFQRERYMGYLNYARISAEEFENKLRKDIKRTKTQRIFEMGAFPLKAELQKLSILENTKVNVQFAKVDTSELFKKQTASAGEIAAFLKSEENMKKAQSYYNAHSSEYQEQEQVRASHILLKFKAGDAAGEKAALAKAEELKAKALKGDDFAKLATENTEDLGSKTKGGDLGFFGRGAMVPEFEMAAFGAKAGEIVGPVKSNFGYHIIKVSEKKEAKKFSFAEVQDRVVGEILAEEKGNAAIAQLNEILKENKGSELDNFLKSAQIKWEETGEFNLSADAVPKVGANEAVMGAVIKLKTQGQVSSELVKDNKIAYILKLKSKVVSADDEKVASKVEQIARERGNSLFSDWMEAKKKTMKITRNEELLRSQE